MKHEVIGPLTYSPKSRRSMLDEEVLIKEYMPLVRKLAWQVHGGNNAINELEDLIQIGLIALLEAGRNYQDVGANFGSYASLRIRGAMIDELRRQATVTRKGIQNAREINAARKTIEDRKGSAADHAEIASFMGIDINEYFSRMESGRSAKFEPIDEVYTEDSSDFVDLFVNFGDGMNDDTTLSILTQEIAKMGERDAMVIQLYFLEQLNLAEISEILNVGIPRVSQIKKAALERLKNALEAADANQ